MAYWAERLRSIAPPSVFSRPAPLATLTSIAENLTRAFPLTNNGRGITVLTLQNYNIQSQGARNGVIVLMTVASFVLLIACANIAGMLLARGAVRVHEMAVRAWDSAGQTQPALPDDALTRLFIVSDGSAPCRAQASG